MRIESYDTINYCDKCGEIVAIYINCRCPYCEAEINIEDKKEIENLLIFKQKLKKRGTDENLLTFKQKLEERGVKITEIKMKGFDY